jgi:hypothetical protein
MNYIGKRKGIENVTYGLRNAIDINTGGDVCPEKELKKMWLRGAPPQIDFKGYGFGGIRVRLFASMWLTMPLKRRSPYTVVARASMFSLAISSALRAL